MKEESIVCLLLTLHGVKEKSSVFVSDTEWRERGKVVCLFVTLNGVKEEK